MPPSKVLTVRACGFLRFRRELSTDRSPLQGVRILDLSRVLAGPFATMVLGDLGAEVIKIEKPRVGDDTRSWGPPFLHPSPSSRETRLPDNSAAVGVRESTYFLSVNRNKKSVCVDIRTSEGQSLIRQLAGKCDILVENYKPGELEKKGLGYSNLRDIAPQLVYCSITGFGPEGPYKDRGGYDVIAASMGGLSHVTGEREGGPMKVGVAMTDLATALYAHGAILAALYQREKTGLGQKINCNLLSTQVSAMVNLASSFLNAGTVPGRWGTAHASIVPYQTFKTSDGYMTVGCGSNAHFRKFCERIGEPSLPDQPAFTDNEDRVKNREELVSVLAARLVTRTNQDWSVAFQGCGFPYGPVNTLEQVFSDPQVVFNKLHQRIQHSTLGEISQVGPAVGFSYAENRIRSAPPTLGEHTDTVLRDILGLSTPTIQMYRQRGIVS